ncbi:MAG: immunoglobulin-like domain-containing protein [Congregibacter sp.]
MTAVHITANEAGSKRKLTTSMGLGTAIMLVAGLSACGGGGSNSPSSDDTAQTADTTPPVLALNGPASLDISLNSNFIDTGATATDDIDGDLTGSIVTTSNVNPAIAGSYSVAYNVTDSSGNAASEMVRIVNVLAPEMAISMFGPDCFVEIESGTRGFTATLESGDRFGRDHDIVGDVNGDGVTDLVIGARSDDDGATDAGAVYILFMNNDGSVQSNQKISALEGGFADTLVASNFFGYGVAGIGDYDGDNIPDIAVSATNQANRAIYVIHLNADGSVKDYVKNVGLPGTGLTAVGDLNGDGKIDLVAGEPGAAGGGAIHLLFFDAASQVLTADAVVISSTEGGFGTGLAEGDEFGGREVAMLGDIDGDGTRELAVGAFQSDDGRGAIWILSLDNTSFNVVSKVEIASNLSGFDELIATDPNPNGTVGGQFGHAMAAVGDLNGDGIADLFTGANQYNEGYGYILYMNANKTVKAFTRINANEGGFDLALDPDERFSRSISFIGDLRGDGSIVVNVGGGAGAGGTGKLYLLFFEACDLELQSGNNFWTGGNTLFSNWDHTTQIVTGAVSLEQCSTHAFEQEGPHVTFNPADGRCIVMDATAQLSASTEGSVAYTRQCPSDF